MEEIFDYKRNTGCSTERNSRRKNKKFNAQGINYIAENNAKKRKEFLPEAFDFFHDNNPFKTEL